MNPFTAQLAAERIRDLRADRRTSRGARRRSVRNWIVRNQLGPTHNYVYR
jgi:hypothetical protein